MTRRRARAEAVAAAARLGWVYDFWSGLAPYAYSRPEDRVVILPPNLVYKTNSSGAALLDYITRGGRFEEIPGFDSAKADEVAAFFLQLKAVYEGRTTGHAPGVESIPYDFSFTRLPVLGEIAVTYRCNNRCRFCYAGCGSDGESSLAAGGSSLAGRFAPIGGTDQLDTAGMRRVIDIFRDEAKIPFFSFTGGEPLLRADLEALAEHAVARGLRINLVTNGTLATKARAQSLHASGIATAQVSLEAPDAETHDTLCGAPGAWRRTLAGIEALMTAGVSVQTNSTLTAHNESALLDLPAFVSELGITRMSMNLFIPVGAGLNADDLFVSYTRAASFIDEARSRASSAGVEFFWYSPIPMCIYNPIARGLGNKSCAACDGLISVAPNGDVLPCSSYPTPVGNLLSDGFHATWFSESASFFKNKNYAPAECRSCSAFTACQSACPLYWDYAGCAEIAGRSRAATPNPSPTQGVS